MIILAIGGGAFDIDQPKRSALDRYIISLSPKTNPKICHIPTASGDAILGIARFKKAAELLACEPTVCELYRPPSRDLEDFILSQDIIYVGGGSTYNMLALWRAWNLDTILKKAWQQGIPLTGTSAGANCWFRRCSTDSFHGELSEMDALNWIPIDFCPHYDEEENRRPTLHKLIAEGKMGRTLACDGGAGCLFHGTEFQKVVSTSKMASAYWVEEDGKEFRINPELLTL
jgi:dipeptidase E